MNVRSTQAKAPFHELRCATALGPLTAVDTAARLFVEQAADNVFSSLNEPAQDSRANQFIMGEHIWNTLCSLCSHVPDDVLAPVDRDTTSAHAVAARTASPTRSKAQASSSSSDSGWFMRTLKRKRANSAAEPDEERRPRRLEASSAGAHEAEQPSRVAAASAIKARSSATQASTTASPKESGSGSPVNGSSGGGGSGDMAVQRLDMADYHTAQTAMSILMANSVEEGFTIDAVTEAAEKSSSPFELRDLLRVAVKFLGNSGVDIDGEAVVDDAAEMDENYSSPESAMEADTPSLPASLVTSSIDDTPGAPSRQQGPDLRSGTEGSKPRGTATPGSSTGGAAGGGGVVVIDDSSDDDDDDDDDDNGGGGVVVIDDSSKPRGTATPGSSTGGAAGGGGVVVIDDSSDDDDDDDDDQASTKKEKGRCKTITVTVSANGSVTSDRRWHCHFSDKQVDAMVAFFTTPGSLGTFSREVTAVLERDYNVIKSGSKQWAKLVRQMNGIPSLHPLAALGPRRAAFVDFVLNVSRLSYRRRLSVAHKGTRTAPGGRSQGRVQPVPGQGWRQQARRVRTPRQGTEQVSKALSDVLIRLCTLAGH